MANRTRRFGLTTFDQPTDELSLDNYKFTYADRILLDRLLRIIIESHVHDGSTFAAAQPPAPELTVQTTGGAIPANTTVYYRYSVVDARGQETIASATASTVTPPQVAAPGFGPRLSREAGTLDAGQYLYALSACTNDAGQETLIGPTTPGTLTDWGAWRLDLPPLPSGGQFFNVYRKGPRESELRYLTTLAPAQRELFDTGLLKTDRYRRAPAANTTNMTNRIGVALTGTVPEGSWTWRIYRTYDQGNWENSLVEWVGPENYYLDDGREGQPGVPPSASAAIGGASKIEFATDTEGMPPPSAWGATIRSVNFTANRVVPSVGTWYWYCDYERVEPLTMRAAVRRGAPPTVQPIQIGLDYAFHANGGLSWWYPWNDTSGNPVIATIDLGQTFSASTSIANPEQRVVRGYLFRLHIYQGGYEEFPLDPIHDLTVVMTMMVNGESDQTYIWETS